MTPAWTSEEGAAPPKNPPAAYFPPSRGVYEVVAGLSSLAMDFGNGPVDGLAFQFDREFPRYRAAKLEARAEGLGRHHLQRDLPDAVRRAATRFIAARLAEEHPARFDFHTLPGGGAHLACAMTGEGILFDGDWNLARFGGAAPAPPFAGALDALAAQIQEDFALVAFEGGVGRTAALHVCFPSHWAPEAKIGLDFAAIHAPVAGFERIARASAQTLAACVEKGPFTRFAWSVTADPQLNLHPARKAPRPLAAAQSADQLWLRVERQVIQGFPEAGGFLFLIRVYLRRADELIREERKSLAQALATMPEESRRYKGLSEDGDRLAALLNA